MNFTQEQVDQIIREHRASATTERLFLRQALLAKAELDHQGTDEVTLDSITFTRLGPIIENIDFSECHLTNCDFSHTYICNCTFPDDISTEDANQFDGCKLSMNVNCPEFIRQTHQDSVVMATHTGFFRVAESFHLRQNAWGTYNFKQFPEDWLQLADTITYDTNASDCQELSNYLIISNEDGYRHYKRHLKTLTSPMSWKLHISVAREDIEKAFNLVAPQLLKIFPQFKVILLEQAYNQEGRTAIGAQFSIVLKPFEGSPLSLEVVAEQIDIIHSMLSAAGISPGVIPISDFHTKSPYFSMRCDGIQFANEDPKSGYLPAFLVGSQCNPFAAYSEYLELAMDYKLGEFNATSHFLTFNLDSSKYIESHDAIRIITGITIMAMIVQHLDLDKISEHPHIFHDLLRLEPGNDSTVKLQDETNLAKIDYQKLLKSDHVGSQAAINEIDALVLLLLELKKIEDFSASELQEALANISTNYSELNELLVLAAHKLTDLSTEEEKKSPSSDAPYKVFINPALVSYARLSIQLGEIFERSGDDDYSRDEHLSVIEQRAKCLAEMVGASGDKLDVVSLCQSLECTYTDLKKDQIALMDKHFSPLIELGNSHAAYLYLHLSKELSCHDTEDSDFLIAIFNKQLMCLELAKDIAPAGFCESRENEIKLALETLSSPAPPAI